MKPKNKYHGNEDYSDMSKDDWEDCWKEGKTFFHRTEYHPMLLEHLDKLISKRSGLDILVPLCGKSLDLKLFYDNGHTVIGVEGAKAPIEEFFSENKLKPVKSECPDVNGILFKTEDGRIRIYHCNMFDFNRKVEGLVDAVWDRGSFGAINKTDRPRYAELLVSFMKEDTEYLLNTYDYDPGQYSGKWCDVERLSYMDVNNDSKREQGVEYFYEQLHHLKMKR